MSKADFGVIGLGVMGENVALNIEERGYRVAVFNRSFDKTEEVVARNPGKRLIPASELNDFVASIERPRRILLMIKAGAPVDATLESLLPLLEKDDVVIDGGNEFFGNTERRSREVEARNIRYVGMGVSGGEEGARHGPSLMPGGSKPAYDAISDVLEKIAARVSDGPCVTHIGPGGSGHYVKMVHNGIEYGDMQLIAETYDFLKNGLGLHNETLAETFEAWNHTELESYLIEITAKIFRQPDPETGGSLVDSILDTAQMKGTGSWTVQSAAQQTVPIPTMSAAVDGRLLSGMRPLRLAGAKLLEGPKLERIEAKLTNEWIDAARMALFAAKACSYAQGIHLIQSASAHFKWVVNISEVARIWKGGCIIRAAFLGRIQEAYGQNAALEHLLFDRYFREQLAQNQQAWRKVVRQALKLGIPVPALSASLAYYDTIRRARTPANLVQAQRDLFGAHTYERLDKPGTFHTQWNA
jgi:6-phosphogluconate dehydrogenase